MNTSAATCSIVAAGGDVEKAQLICALFIVTARNLDRVPGVAQFDEVDALDHAAAGHV
jgi:hypothetical protein